MARIRSATLEISAPAADDSPATRYLVVARPDAITWVERVAAASLAAGPGGDATRLSGIHAVPTPVEETALAIFSQLCIGPTPSGDPPRSSPCSSSR